MADSGAFVDDLDAMFLEIVDMLLGLVTRGFDDPDAGLDDRGAIFRIRRRFDRRQDGEIHAERLVGHVPRPGDFPGQGFRRRLGERRQEAERAGVRDRSNELGLADPHHSALCDRMLNSEQLGKSGSDHLASAQHYTNW